MDNVQKISIDIMNNKYSDYIYAKQYDRNRVVNFTITENGKKKSLDGTFCTFLMKGKQYTSYETLTKNQDVFKLIVTSKETREAGKIPYQLLLTSGQIEIIDGQIHWLEEGTIIGTVTGYVLVEPCVIDKDELEDQYDEGIIDQLFAAIAATGDVVAEAEELCEKADKDAVKSQSYAIGGTESRTGEDTDNSKYYSEVSKSYAIGGTTIPHGDKPDTQDNAKYFYEQTEALKDQYIVTETIELRTTGQATEKVGVWNVTTRECEVALQGIKAEEDEQLIIVRPYNNTDNIPYMDEYIECNVRCIQQAENKLKFKCDTIPGFNLKVHVNTQFMYVAGDIRKSNIVVSDTEPSAAIMNTNDYWVQDYTVPPNNEEVGE